MISKFLRAAGVKSEAEFYKKYPNEEDFFNAHPEMAVGGEPDLPQAGMYPGFIPEYTFGNNANGAMEYPEMDWESPVEADPNLRNAPLFAPPAMDWGDPADAQRFATAENNPAGLSPSPTDTTSSGTGKKLNIKDYLRAGTERLQQNSDKFMAAYNNPVSAINMLGYAGNIADKFSNKKKEKAMDQYYRNQFSSDMYMPQLGPMSGDRGDYSTTGSSYGMYRPNQAGSKSPYGQMAFGGEGPDEPIDPKTGKPYPKKPKPRPYQPDITLPNWDGMVEKADGSIGMWGNDWPDQTRIPAVPMPPPQAFTDHVGRQSGSYYQGSPTNDQKIQAIRRRLMMEAAANPIKRYKQGGQYDVTPEELARLISAGAQIEFL